MANKLIEFIMIREILRLKHCGFSHLKISERLGISRTTVLKYLGLFGDLGRSYPNLLSLSDTELSGLLQIAQSSAPDTRYESLEMLFPKFAKELKKPGVSRHLLWQDYRRDYPDGYGYSQFCLHLQKYFSRGSLWMHIEHKAGDKLFVDYAGKKLSFTDPVSGAVQETEVFVGVLGASGMTFVQASLSQKLEDFISSLEDALWYFGGVPQAVVPDNLKSAVTKSSLYEPIINETFADFSRYYDTCVLPARAGKPKDKALVEGTIKIVYSRIYTRLDKQTYFSLADLNAAILQMLIPFNGIAFQGKETSRKTLFDDLDKPALKNLPRERYNLRQYWFTKVKKNTHVYLKCDRHYYSVPYKYVDKKVKIAYSKTCVEIYYNQERIAIHKRNLTKDTFSTISEHLAPTHRFVAGWSQEKFLSDTKAVGEQTHELAKKIFEQSKHPEAAFKSCLGILKLAAKVGNQRMEKACARATYFRTYTYRSVKKILENNMEKLPLETQKEYPQIASHKNIRGKQYYK
jgi:transposase